ncbi:MAG TPA: insulinase family protein, partial [Tenuifilaceae bacterium]|nr:insulinase family protein [Tenuifilaceae bacterium]
AFSHAKGEIFSTDSLNQPRYLAQRNQLYAAALTLIQNQNELFPLKALDTLRIASISLGDGNSESFLKTLRLYAKIQSFSNITVTDTLQVKNLETKLKSYNLVLISLHSNSLNAGKKFGVSDEEIQINLYGLSENAEKAMSLMESLLNDSKPDAEALKSYVANQLKARNDSKKNQSTVFRALVSYATYGAENPFNYILSEEQLKALTPEVLIQKVKALSTYPHTVLYYGTANQSDLKKMLTTYHKLPKKSNATPLNKKFVELDTPKNRVVFGHYEAKQSYLQTISKSVPYSFELYPIVSVYNDYFGGGMNAIVFQELREKRGLAYTARARFNTPSKPDRVFVNTSYIATQNDKIVDAFNAFNELFNDMPEVELGFNLSKESAISDIRTNRTEKMDLLWSYVSAKEMGWNTDIRKVMFEKIPTFTLSDVKKFQEQYVKGKSKTYVILGKEADMDFGKLEQLYGPVTKLTLEDIFGY